MMLRGNAPSRLIKKGEKHDPFTSFTRQAYLNLETFRKSGAGVRTPVWFVQTGDTVYIRTAANSGKVKRIRNNHHVNIAPCKMNGDPLDEWLPALAPG